MLQLLSEILFPPYCINCQKNSELVCAHCLQKLNFFSNFINTEPNKFFSQIQSVCDYEGLAKKIIHEYKYKSIIGLADTMAGLIYHYSTLPTVDIITGIPLHPIKQKWRGFNQSYEIAERLALLTNSQFVETLIKKENTSSQASISDKKLRLFSANKFSLSPTLDKSLVTNKSILIFDDVTTTGSTLIKAAKIISKLNPQKIYCLTFAHGQ